ncbi:MAG: hypothetical protein H6649_15125 [Caldilineae bacterium]|nr:hypothetical protein [Caldilineae bacterium]
MLRNIALGITAIGVMAAACAPPTGPAGAPASESTASQVPASTDTPTAAVMTPKPSATPTVSPLRTMAAPVIADLAGRLGIDEAVVEVVDAVEVEWPDTSLGCPAPGDSYAQVLTNGTQLTLQVNGQTYDYRGRSPDTMFLCGPQGPLPAGKVP